MAGGEDKGNSAEEASRKLDAKQRRLELDKQQRPPADKQVLGGRDKSIGVRATQ